MEDWEPVQVLFGAMLGCFGVQVGGLGGLSWRFGSLFGVYVGSCRAQMEVWEALLRSILGLVGRRWGFGRPRGNREGVWKGLGWSRGGWGLGSGPNMAPT